MVLQIKKKSKLWEELNGLANLCEPNWLIGGDFNVFRWNTKTSFPNPAKYNMKKFNTFILRSQLIDPPLINGSFTWSNLREEPVLSRLDRFLYSPNWEQDSIAISVGFSQELPQNTTLLS